MTVVLPHKHTQRQSLLVARTRPGQRNVNRNQMQFDCGNLPLLLMLCLSSNTPQTARLADDWCCQSSLTKNYKIIGQVAFPSRADKTIQQHWDVSLFVSPSFCLHISDYLCNSVGDFSTHSAVSPVGGNKWMKSLNRFVQKQLFFNWITWQTHLIKNTESFTNKTPLVAQLWLCLELFLFTEQKRTKLLANKM